MTSPEAGLDQKIQTLAEMMFVFQKIVVFTGAGISTDSGLSDFQYYYSGRFPNGIRKKRLYGISLFLFVGAGP